MNDVAIKCLGDNGICIPISTNSTKEENKPTDKTGEICRRINEGYYNLDGDRLISVNYINLPTKSESYNNNEEVAVITYV